jgi:hypothetical protein
MQEGELPRRLTLGRTTLPSPTLGTQAWNRTTMPSLSETCTAIVLPGYGHHSGVEPCLPPYKSGYGPAAVTISTSTPYLRQSSVPPRGFEPLPSGLEHPRPIHWTRGAWYRLKELNLHHLDVSQRRCRYIKPARHHPRDSNPHLTASKAVALSVGPGWHVSHHRIASISSLTQLGRSGEVEVPSHFLSNCGRTTAAPDIGVGGIRDFGPS